MPDFAIVTAELHHLDLLAPLFDGYRHFYEKPSDLDGARHFLAERLTHHESVIFLALQGEIQDEIGLGFTQLYPSFSSVSMKRLWILNDLFVAPEGRRQGVARALLERARDHALETGAKGLMLETAIHNFSAQQLYSSLGWVRESDFYVYNLSV
jgi:GNAT superfamily N-acetyltransferase